MRPPTPSPPQDPSRRRPRALLQGAVIAIVLCASALGGWWYGQRDAARVTQAAPAPAAKPVEPSPPAVAMAPKSRPKAASRAPKFASFGSAVPTAGVRHVADWAVDSGDNGRHSFVVVDKRDARVWVFNPRGVLIAHTPALVGAAVGDDPVPGIGEKPLSQVLPEEKTTPAGRYVAERGVNLHGEDIVWVSYDLAVSMHRVRPTVKAERRLQRLASRTSRDNRISFGCINLPVAFYERVLVPAVRRHGAIVYVLPETRTPQEQFGSYDVPARRRGARAAPA